MKKLTVNEQEELFAQDCKLINLRYEYWQRETECYYTFVRETPSIRRKDFARRRARSLHFFRNAAAAPVVRSV